MNRYPARDNRTNLPQDLRDLLGEEEEGSGLSDLSQSLTSQSDSNANDSDFTTPTISRTNSTEYMPARREEEEAEVRVNNLDNPAGVEVAAGAGGPAAVAGVQEAGGQILAGAPEGLQVPLVQAGDMGDTTLLATYDDLTGIELGLEFQRILCFYCWDIRFYLNEAYVKRTVN